MLGGGGFNQPVHQPPPVEKKNTGNLLGDDFLGLGGSNGNQNPPQQVNQPIISEQKSEPKNEFSFDQPVQVQQPKQP